MINLEQVKLLEAKVAKTIDFVDRISKENAALQKREAELQGKLEAYQKRIDELEVLITGFKEEQERIEDGILSALDRLSKFENAVEKSLKEKPAGKPAKDAVKSPQKAAAKAPAPEDEAPDEQPEDDSSSDAVVFDENICFEIAEDETGDDILDPLIEALDEGTVEGDSPDKGGELDIF